MTEYVNTSTRTACRIRVYQYMVHRIQTSSTDSNRNGPTTTIVTTNVLLIILCIEFPAPTHVVPVTKTKCKQERKQGSASTQNAHDAGEGMGKASYWQRAAGSG